MITVCNLDKSYKTEYYVTEVLKDVNLQIPSHSVVAITGKSGVGKSTLLNIMCGLDKADQGKIVFDEEDISDYSPKQLARFRLERCGYVFQDFQLISTLNVRDNIVLPSVEKNRAIDEEWYKEVIRITGLEEKEIMLPANLSGGERQRVAIARAIMNKPSYLFADEPTGNLDKENSEKVMSFLISYARDNQCTLVYVTHDTELCKHADYVLVIRDKNIFGNEVEKG